jgi:S1-C subfamily serine protease
MSAQHVRCPECDALVERNSDGSARHWCTACDAVFEAAPEEPVPDALPVEEDDRSPRRAERAREPGPLLAIAAVSAVVLALAVGAGVYFAMKKDEPNRVADAPKGDAPKAEPPKPAPKPPPKQQSPEEIVRRVKGATVYVRAEFEGGLWDTGSGFVAGKPGFVVTNAHVVGYGPRFYQAPKTVEIVIDSGETNEQVLTATVFGVDPEEDLALLKVEGGDLPVPLPFGKAGDLVETAEVVIYGYPFGELLGKNVSVNRSTVSSLRKENGRLTVVQLAGGLNPGNSGGPVTNAKGEVIGVSVAKLRGTDTIAFAIPAETADEFVKDQHRLGGRIDTGRLVALERPPVPVRPVRPPRTPVNRPFPPEHPPANAPRDDANATVVKLPAEIGAVCVGGSGQLIVVSLPKTKEVAIFDVAQGKVAKLLPAPAEKVLLAAGADKLFVADPATNVIQRGSRTTYEKEATANLPTTEGLTLTNIATGSGSHGPLLVQALDWPRLGEWYLFDPATMKEIEGPPRHKSGTECEPNDRVFASLDGRTMIVNRERSSSVLTIAGNKWTTAHAAWDDRRRPGFVSADGGTVYGGKGESYSASGKRLGRNGETRHCVPATDGPLVFALTDRVDVHDENRGFDLAVHAPRDSRPAFPLPTFESIRTLFVPNVGWHLDGRVFFVSKAKTVVVLPRSNDRFVLYKVDADAELAKADIDYLFVATLPPAAAPGAKYEYAIGAKSKKGGVKYKLEFGPDGLTVGPDGKVTWTAPADFAKPEPVAVTVSDDSGQEVIHSFEVVPTK